MVGLAAVAGCSSHTAPPPPTPAGSLTAGTARITVNDDDLGEFHAVQCTPAGAYLTISTGNDQQGSTVVAVSNVIADRAAYSSKSKLPTTLVTGTSQRNTKMNTSSSISTLGVEQIQLGLQLVSLNKSFETFKSGQGRLADTPDLFGQ